MSTKVLKFGGTSLSCAQQICKAAEIIRADDSRRFVVVSAPGKRCPEDRKITDLLYQCCALAREDRDVEPLLGEIRQRFVEIRDHMGVDLPLEPEFDRIRAALRGTPDVDYVVSRGEYLNARLLSLYLGFPFVDAAAGIFFREDDSLDGQRTYATLGALLSQAGRAVIPGFYGVAPDGSIKTFSRGGSDITGAIAARAAGADLYENWTDVSGMLMADPRIVENPRVLREITYRELRDLTSLGATVLHADAVAPVWEARIPLNIRNTNDPQDPGTRIVPALRDPSDAAIAGVAGRTGFSSLHLEKDRLHRDSRFAWKVLSVLERFSLPCAHIPTGVNAMSVVVPSDALAPCREPLSRELLRDTQSDALRIEDGLALVAMVGRDRTPCADTVARAAGAIAARGISVRMVDHGASEYSVVFGVREADYRDAVRALYDEFVM